MNQRDQEYLDSWEKLDPALLAQLKAEGVTGPELDHCCVFHPEYQQDIPVDPQQPFAGLESDEKVCEVVRRIIGELLCQSNPALAIECFSLVTGIGYLGDSMTEIGKRHGVTRAAVSKRCIEFADALGIDSSRAMRKKKSPKRCSPRRPEVVHPHVNRVVTLFGRLRNSGWLRRQDADQLRCICSDLEPVRNICRELEDLIEEKESI